MSAADRFSSRTTERSSPPWRSRGGPPASRRPGSADRVRLAARGRRFRARRGTTLRRRRRLAGQGAAEATAAHGVTLAKEAGFEALAFCAKVAPTWKGLVELADEHERA